VAADSSANKHEAMRPTSFDYFHIVKYKYWDIMFIREENTPEYVEYLGYLDAKKLYPDLVTTSLEEFAQQSIDGKVQPLYS
jgi:hypothetical protein